jgi:hypothetical protein
MGAFEQQPWLLFLVIIVTEEAWNAVKAVVNAMLRRRRVKVED